MHRKKILVIIILFLSTFTVSSLISESKIGGKELPNTLLIGREYFPTDPKIKLTYNSSLGEASANITQKGKKFILDLSNDDFYFKQTVFVANDTIYLTQLDQMVEVFLFISSKSSVTYSQPYLRFPFPLKSKDTWEWNGVEYIDGKNPDTIKVSGKVLGEELVETEAGKFECVKFQIDIHKKKRGTHTKFYEWRSPNIGLVKLEAFIDSKGFIGNIMKILGYDEMKFELKKIG